MITIISKMILCLILAGILGGIIGWLLRKLFSIPKKEVETIVRGKDDEIAMLKKRAEFVQGELSKSEMNAREKATAIVVLERELQNTRSRLGGLESECANARREVETMTTETQELIMKLAGQQRENEELAKSVASIDELHIQISRRDERIATLEEENQQLLKDNESGCERLQVKANEMAMLQTALTEKIAAHDHSQTEIASLKERAHEVEGLRSKVSTLTQYFQEQEGLWANKLSEKDALNDKLTSQIQAFESDAIKTRELVLKLEAVEVQNNELKTEKGGIVESLRVESEKVQAATAENNSLKERLHELAVRFSRLEREHQSLQSSKDEHVSQLLSRIQMLEPIVAKVQEFEQKVDVYQSDLATLRRAAEESNQQQSALIGDRERVRTELTQLQTRHTELSNRHAWLVNEKDAEIKRQAGHIEEIRAALKISEDRITSLGELSKNNARTIEEKSRIIAELESRLAGLLQVERLFDESRNRNKELEEQLRAEKDVHNHLVGNLQTRQSELDRMLGHITDWEQKYSALQQQFEQIVAEKQKEIDRVNAMIRENDTTRVSGSGSTQTHDDLKMIHGVGPVLERMLHQLGVHTFKQVARWSEADIDRIDAHLKQFQGRIRRENWVASAREEHRKKYGEAL